MHKNPFIIYDSGLSTFGFLINPYNSNSIELLAVVNEYFENHTKSHLHEIIGIEVCR